MSVGDVRLLCYYCYRRECCVPIKIHAVVFITVVCANIYATVTHEFRKVIHLYVNSYFVLTQTLNFICLYTHTNVTDVVFLIEI